MNGPLVVRRRSSDVAAAIVGGRVRIFVAARFSGVERHVRRLAEVEEIQNDNVVAPGTAASARATAEEIEV